MIFGPGAAFGPMSLPATMTVDTKFFDGDRANLPGASWNTVNACRHLRAAMETTGKASRDSLLRAAEFVADEITFRLKQEADAEQEATTP